MNQNKKTNNFNKNSKIKIVNKKHWKKITFFFSGLFFVAITPIIALAGTNNNPYNTYLFRHISLDNVQKNENNLEAYNLESSKMPVVPVSYGQLVRGTTTYNEGNYVLYFGTEVCSHCMQFLFNNSNLSKGIGSMGDGPDQASWEKGDWGKAIKFASTNLKSKNLQFIMYEDTPPISEYNDHDWTLPWTKYSETNLKSGQILGDYIRNDKSAIDFRKIFDFASSNFSFVKGTPTVIAYKKGIAKEYIFNPSEDTSGSTQSNLTSFINQYYQ